MLTYELWLAVMHYFQPFGSQAAVHPLEAQRKAPVRLRNVDAGRVADEATDAVRGAFSGVTSYRESAP